jgi:hypothetical protein
MDRLRARGGYSHVNVKWRAPLFLFMWALSLVPVTYLLLRFGVTGIVIMFLLMMLGFVLALVIDRKHRDPKMDMAPDVVIAAMVQNRMMISQKLLHASETTGEVKARVLEEIRGKTLVHNPHSHYCSLDSQCGVCMPGGRHRNERARD